MRPYRRIVVACSLALALPLAGCDGGGKDEFPKPECSDGKDNDGDGLIDFPDDPGCTSPSDDSEDSLPEPQCKDGRDNDGDGKIDYPNDPGCFAPQQDSEEDDCPNGPSCPQCSNGIDDDENGLTDFPADASGCSAASDTDEYTRNPAACGSNVQIQMLPFDGVVMGTLMAGGASSLMSPTCGGTGAEHVYEIRIKNPKVIVASTDHDGTGTTDTVLYLRSAECQNSASEVICHDDVTTSNKRSTITQSIATPGTYYLVVDSKTALGGPYELSVKYFVGEGETCTVGDDCGPGLVCRIPVGGTGKVCARHVCEDGLDDDGDGKIDYPADPGCTHPQDDSEDDDCPNGPNCPECANGIDDDNDGLIDFGMDPTCIAASGASEACPSTDGVTLITTPQTMGTTVGANNDGRPACAGSATTHTAPDRMYRINVPQLSSLTISANTTWFMAIGIYNATCTGAHLACFTGSSTPNTTMTNVSAGTYYIMVDGYSTASGAYTLNVAGKIVNGGSCESALAQSGALTCDTGYACKGTVGSRTCQPALCSDGIDNDMDGLIDYPADPGCDSPADDSENNPATPPICKNNVDDDMDGLMDYPADYGCHAASGSTEVFCQGEMDATAAITTKTVTGTTSGKSNDWTPTCASSTAPDVSYALILPVPVATLQVDTIGSTFDSMLMVRSLDCTTQIACDDQSGGSNNARIIMNNVAPGGYALVVDGWLSQNGNYTLNVQGTVAPQTACNSPLFSGGANAVLLCPTGTTCTGSPLRCQ
jgi:large repetitive protein